MTVVVYAIGLVHASVCAPIEMSKEEIATAVNMQEPAGTENGWKIDEHPEFHNGQPNPCECNLDPGKLHWLMVC
jgi:hypothetical protein